MRMISKSIGFLLVVLMVSLFLYQRYHRVCPECDAVRARTTGILPPPPPEAGGWGSSDDEDFTQLSTSIKEEEAAEAEAEAAEAEDEFLD